MKQTEEFTHIRGFLLNLINTIGGKKYGEDLANLYAKFWNPINYALIGGFGVIINYLVWLLFVSSSGLPWFFINAIAIIMAWSWNWANSVGPLGWLWGFKKRGE